MNALTRFEDLVERLMEGSFARLFHSPVQPAEIARKIERTMLDHRLVGVGRTIVPNSYLVQLAPADFGDLEDFQGTLERELERYVQEAAQESEVTLSGRPVVTLEARAGVPRRGIAVTASSADEPERPGVDLQTRQVKLPTRVPPPAVTAALVLDPASEKARHYPLRRTRNSIGRHLANDLVLDDPRISRQHAIISYDEGVFVLSDVGSTNGTCVNGNRVSEAALREGDEISFGGFRVTFTTAHRQGDGPRSTL